MQELRQQYPIAGLLKLAGLARSTFYYQQKALLAADKYADLKGRIRSIYARHKGRYGYRRITATIQKMGTLVKPQDSAEIDDVARTQVTGQNQKIPFLQGRRGLCCAQYFTTSVRGTRAESEVGNGCDGI
ncbi:transposase [Undibacterium piscinae]|uniref:Transposase n=1 Tax=Undibacterium piscinae TaxID=2495591 RepID=A0A6M4A879_9BURK|nr:transposase [Undibacterium piscinae]